MTHGRPTLLNVCAILAACMPDAHEGQKSTSDPLKLELWMVVNCLAGAKNQTQVLCENSKCS